MWSYLDNYTKKCRDFLLNREMFVDLYIHMHLQYPYADPSSTEIFWLRADPLKGCKERRWLKIESGASGNKRRDELVIGLIGGMSTHVIGSNFVNVNYGFTCHVKESSYISQRARNREIVIKSTFVALPPNFQVFSYTMLYFLIN